MAEDEEQLAAGNVVINTATISNETPSEPFRITIELPIFLIMTGISLCGAALSNIILYRACVHDLGHSKEECMVFLSLEKNNRTDLEDEVQKYTTSLSTLRSVLEGVIPAILSLFLGVWSDTHGRKPLLVWPLFGLTVSSLLQVGYCMVDVGAWWFIPTILPYSICGGFTIFFTGAFCYLSDITSTKDRSLRMTLLGSSTSVGSIVGSLLSSHVLRLVGYTWLIVIAATLNVVAYAFTNVYIKESIRGALQGGITTIFDLLLVKEMVRECFKRRANNGRAQILLLTIANSLSILILYGQISLQFYYTREKLHWTLSDYTIFDASSTSISFFGAFIGIALLQKLMGLSDLVSATIAFICAMAEYITRAAAVSSWHMYLGAVLGLFKNLSAPLIRSFLTKILPVVDIAKVFALLSAIEGICPVLAPLLYNSLYWYTLSTFPAAIYVLSSAILVICITCISTVIYFRWNATSLYQRLE